MSSGDCYQLVRPVVNSKGDVEAGQEFRDMFFDFRERALAVMVYRMADGLCIFGGDARKLGYRVAPGDDAVRAAV